LTLSSVNYINTAPLESPETNFVRQ